MDEPRATWLVEAVLSSTVPARAAITSPPHGPAQRPPAPPELGWGLIPALGRPRMISWEAGHGRSC